MKQIAVRIGGFVVNAGSQTIVLDRNVDVEKSNARSGNFPGKLESRMKLDKSLRNSLVKGSLSTELEPGTFKCSRKRCNTSPYITNTVSISGPKNSTQITDHFDCTSRNVIYCIRCTACNQLYIGETGRRLGDRFREHLLDVKNNSQDVSKPVARHFNQPGHSHNNMKTFGLSLHQGNTESRKCTEQRLIFKIGTLSPAGINERFSFS